MSIDSGNGTTPMTITTTNVITDKKMRVEFGGSSMDSIEPRGAAMIVNERDSTATNIIPSQQMAMVMPMRMMTMTRTLFQQAPVLTTDSVEDLGAGPIIAGHATRHVRRTEVGSIHITLADGRSCDQPLNAVSEIWIAPDIDPDSVMLNMMATAGGGSTAGWDAMMKQSRAKLPKGVPVKTISTTRSTHEGRPEAVTTTSEVTVVSHGPVDASLFSVPLGYQTMDVAAMAAMAGQDFSATMNQIVEKAASAICNKTS